MKIPLTFNYSKTSVFTKMWFAPIENLLPRFLGKIYWNVNVSIRIIVGENEEYKKKVEIIANVLEQLEAGGCLQKTKLHVETNLGE